MNTGPTPDCPDHFVGAETLICLTCGWDAAVNRYTGTAQLDRLDIRRRREQYERFADRQLARLHEGANA